MKELSVQEKAKAYDEAIEKLRVFYRDYDTVSRLIDVKEELANLLPEIKESEDERMSKYLIKYFEANKDELSKGFKWNGITVEECLAWLEKQGEHANFRNKIQVGDKVTRNKDGVLVNLSQLDRVAKKDNKQGEQIDLANKEYWRGYREGKQEILDKYSELEKQGEKGTNGNEREIPNSTWSKEDEIGLGDALWAIQQARTIAKDENDMGNLWYAEKWLKSIKERYAWKPSGEQIKVCKKVYADILSAKGFDLGTVNSELNRLEEELKKLREE